MTTAALRNKIDTQIDSIATHDINRTLRLVTRYAWIGTALLFICYSYFVGAITFSVIKQQALEQTTKSLISSMSVQEQTYLQTQESLNQDYATTLGLVQSNSIAFAVAKPAFAFNAGQ